MRKLLVLAAAAAALALPAPATAAEECTTLVRVLGANSVSLCQEHVWERHRIYYGCTVDKDFDGQADMVCEPLFMIEYYG